MKKIILILLLTLTLIPSQVLADGMIIEPYRDHWRPIDEDSQLAAINYQHGLEKMIISVNFNMRGINEAVWIFPVSALPSNVAIDVVDQFPRLYGYDVVEKTKVDIDTIMKTARSTQIYPLFLEPSRGVPIIYDLYRSVGGKLAEEAAPSEVVVHEHLEKHGMTTEIITASSGTALYDYLQDKGLNIQKGSIPVLDSYIGKDFTFVVSWVTPPTEEDKIYCTDEQRNASICYTLYDPVCGSDDDTYSNDCVACRNPKVEWYTHGVCEYRRYFRQPGIFISFPTDKIYYPLVPTSAYGSKVIPITVYVLDHVTPEFPTTIKPYTRVNYYIQDQLYIEGLVNFFGDMSMQDVKYTKIEIESPSKLFSEDLFMALCAPAKVVYANWLYGFTENNSFMFTFSLIVLISIISGAIAGKLTFNKPIKFAMLGLSNIFTIIGIGIAIALTRTKKLDKDLKRKLRKEGLFVISTDRKKLFFLILFSIAFLIMTVVIGYIIKLPLTF